MSCPHCQTENEPDAEICFRCGKGLFALVQGAVLAGRYEILSLLGRGGMGVVYQARDRDLDEMVAIKVLRADLPGASADVGKRFRSEIKLARRISHKNVCRIHEYGQADNLRYIVMEYVEGMNLRQVLQGGEGLSPGEAFEAALQIGDGLQAIHEVGIVHRDLKTRNIMLDAKGMIRLMDFGIAKQVGASDTTGATATGQVVGTPEYMSPEQARAQPVGPQSDIYALGIVVYELFTGDVPFRGDTPLATLWKHMLEPPPLDGPAAGRLPRALVPALAKALAKDPRDRFASAKAMAAALAEARADSRVEPGIRPRPSGSVPSASAEFLATGVGTATASAEVVTPQALGQTLERARRQDEAASRPPLAPSGPAVRVPAAPSHRSFAATGLAIAIVVGWWMATPRVVPPEAKAVPAASAPPASPEASAPAETMPHEAPALRPSAPSPSTAAVRQPRPPPAPSPATVTHTPVPSPAPGDSVALEMGRAEPPDEPVVDARPSQPPSEPSTSPVATVNHEEAIRRLIARYKQALETKDISLFTAIKPGLSTAEQRILNETFSRTRSLRVDITVRSLQVEGDRATASVVRRDVVDGRAVKEVQQLFRFARVSAEWVISEISR